MSVGGGGGGNCIGFTGATWLLFLLRLLLRDRPLVRGGGRIITGLTTSELDDKRTSLMG